MSDTSTVDDTGQYYSIKVPGTSGYLRLGQPDNAEESTLPPDPNEPSTPGTGSTSPFDAGIVLYTTGHYQQATPTLTSWSGDSLSVATNGHEVVSASYTLPSQPFTTTFQMAAQLNATIGNVSNFVTGNQLNYWLGNSASTGLGGLLWSNIGLTQNVFGGQIVNVINSAIDVQGLAEAKLQTGYELAVSGEVDLLVSPAANASVSALMSKLQKFFAVIGVAVPAAGIAINDVQTSAGLGYTSDAQKTRDVMIASFSELSTMTAAVIVLQAMVALTGLKAKAAAVAAKGASTAGINMADEIITLKVGVGQAAKIVITPNGVYMRGAECAFMGNMITTGAAVAHDPG